MSPRYTATHAQPRLPRNANPSARKRFSLVAATAVAAAGFGAVTASAGTSAHWTNVITNLAEQHSSSAAAAAGAGSHGLTQAHLDAYVPAPQMGIAGTVEFGDAPARGGTTAFGNIATAAHPADSATDSGVTTPHAPAVPAAAPAAKPAPAHVAPAHAVPAPAHAAAARAHAAPAHAAPAHAAPAHAAPAPAHAAPAHATAAHAAPAHATAAHAAPAPARHAAPAPPPKPYLIYDSVTPSAIPANQAIATYANGNYAASPSSVAGRHVLWIDTNGSDTAANALDVEPGDATPAGAAMWVKTKLTADHGATAIVYTMISDWQSVKADVAGLPAWMQSHVRYWIADPTGVPHVLPGANATQWYWGNSYDITTANPGFQG